MRRAKDLSIENRGHLVGPLHGEEKHASLVHADAFVLPSLSEGLPISVLEAWSYGLPCLLTDQCNLPEGFAANAAMRLPLEAEQMPDALECFLGLSSQELADMGERGQRLVEESFTWSSIASSMTQVYEWMRGERDRPGTVRLD